MGTCDGDQTQTEVCAEQEVCPLENDNTTLILVLGGDTACRTKLLDCWARGASGWCTPG